MYNPDQPWCKSASDPIDCLDGDWGYWDETWCNRHGEYSNEAEAREALQNYITNVLGD